MLYIVLIVAIIQLFVVIKQFKEPKEEILSDVLSFSVFIMLYILYRKPIFLFIAFILLTLPFFCRLIIKRKK